MKASQERSELCRVITLPAGWTPGLRKDGCRVRRTFSATCEHGFRTLDRIPGVRSFLEKHGRCNPAWEPYMQQPSETDTQHTERIKETFWFPKTGIAFAGFPETLFCAPPEGWSGTDQQNAAVPTKRKALASITDRAAKREQQAPALATPAEGIRGEEQQETAALRAKRTSHASNAGQPVKQKQQDVPARPLRLKSPAKKKQQPPAALTPADDARTASAAKPAQRGAQKAAAAQHSKALKYAEQPRTPVEAPKAASTAKFAKTGGQKAAAAQQGKASKWDAQLQQAGSPSAHRPSSPKESPANPSWDTLSADDIRDHLQGAAEEFEAKKADFSMSLEIDAGVAASPEAMIGREVRVFWPADDAWFSGTVDSYNSSSGQHRVLYADGDTESVFLPMERVRLTVSPGETLVAPTPDELTATAQHLLSAADAGDDEAKSGDQSKTDALRKRAAQLLHIAEDVTSAAAKRSLQEAEQIAEAPQPDSAAHDSKLPDINRAPACTMAPGASCTAAADGLSEEEQCTAQPPARRTSSSAQSRARPSLGTVVWAREKGWPHWPAVVITKETSRGLCNIRTVKDGSMLWFLGTFEMGCLKPAEIVAFGEGLQLGLHASCKRSVKLFRAGLQQAHRYLRTGRLPDQMVLDNNDEGWYDEAEEIDEAVDLEGTEFPLRLGKNLQVLRLGRIEWLRPTYHTKKHIFPVGYSAVRAVEFSATRGNFVQCLCEIVASSDSFAPVFRVTPENGHSEEADNPTKVWRALLERQGLAKRAVGLSGLRMFGLDTPTVTKLIQSLPHAARCTSFETWAGEKPEPVPLTAEEEAQQLCLAASCQQLPEGIHAIEARDGSQGACSVCGEEDETNLNHLLQCDGCRGFVHMACYGVPSPPEGRLWLCDLCKLGPERQPACALCPVSGGLMRRTTCGHWVHASCALWTPGTWINSETGLVEGLSKLPKARFQLSCSLCSQTYGACIQCAGSRQCFAAFHPTCAAREGLRMVAVDDGEGSDSDSDTDERRHPGEPGKATPANSRAHRMQPKQKTLVHGEAVPIQLDKQSPADSTAAPADSMAIAMQLKRDTPAADPTEHAQAGDGSPAADTTGNMQPEKSNRPAPIISVLADCTENSSPRDPLAVIQIPQQHAEGLTSLSCPPSGEEPDRQKPVSVAEQPILPALQAQQVAAEPIQEQPEQQPEPADSAQHALSHIVQQIASSHDGSTVPGPGMCHTSPAAPASIDVLVPEDVLCPIGGPASPKRDRRPSAKLADAPTLAPKSPGRPGSPAQHSPAQRKRPARSRKEGTYIGNGMWLMCYCSRHRRALEEMGATRAVVSMTTGQGLQDALSPQPKTRQTPARPQSMPAVQKPRAADTVGRSAECARSSRETAYNHELRRGQRAPDALAAALAKRVFVRKTPYLITTAALPRPANQLAASCGPPFVPLLSSTRPSAPDLVQAGTAVSRHNAFMSSSPVSQKLAWSDQGTVVASIAVVPEPKAYGQGIEHPTDLLSPKRSPRLEGKRASGRLTSYKPGAKKPKTEHVQHAKDGHSSAAAAQKAKVDSHTGKPAADRNGIGPQGEQSMAGILVDRPPRVRCHNASRPTAEFMRACGAGKACDDAESRQPVAQQHSMQSLAERYADMKRTVMERLTCGKSAIHGWGAFTKQAHAEGDMLIEYAGELVRRSVADTRERRCYDKLVGAGTYVFGLNDDVCVDATRAGNMAHLLNHSCEPNAYSRTITVRCMETGTLSDHVVIFAKRSTVAGVELTYDYRFSGDEKLSCNCGAASCRGFVNAAKSRLDGNAQLVLRSRLKAYTGQKLIWDGE